MAECHFLANGTAHSDNDATAFNFDLKFTTSGHPSESDITFTDIPIRQ